MMGVREVVGLEKWDSWNHVILNNELEDEFNSWYCYFQVTWKDIIGLKLHTIGDQR